MNSTAAIIFANTSVRCPLWPYTHNGYNQNTLGADLLGQGMRLSLDGDIHCRTALQEEELRLQWSATCLQAGKPALHFPVRSRVWSGDQLRAVPTGCRMWGTCMSGPAATRVRCHRREDGVPMVPSGAHCVGLFEGDWRGQHQG